MSFLDFIWKFVIITLESKLFTAQAMMCLTRLKTFGSLEKVSAGDKLSSFGIRPALSAIFLFYKSYR